MVNKTAPLKTVRIKKYKKKYFLEKLAENRVKPKKLRPALKSQRLPIKKTSSNICLDNKDSLLFDSFSIAETFKKYYSSLVENLFLKLPKPPNNFEIESVNNYYKKHSLKEKLIYTDIQSDKVFKILKNFDEIKASGLDELSGIFLKDGAKLLITPIATLCNLLISCWTFPDACKIAKFKPFF